MTLDIVFCLKFTLLLYLSVGLYVLFANIVQHWPLTELRVAASRVPTLLVCVVIILACISLVISWPFALWKSRW